MGGVKDRLCRTDRGEYLHNIPNGSSMLLRQVTKTWKFPTQARETFVTKAVL